MRIDKENSEREQRLKFIKQAINNQEFSKQDEIVFAVRKAGYEVTQSSISRDLQALKVGKVGGYYYVPTDDVKPLVRPSAAQVRLLVRSVAPAGNHLLVVKTETGAAHVVAAAFDGKIIEGLIGTVAGDDTFFVATKNKAAQRRVVEALEQL